MEQAMFNAGRIACIGWGSLIWNSDGLPTIGGWRDDGPMLPIEFARESRDGRITLVICPGKPTVQTCWTLLDVPDLRAAMNRLGMREYDKADEKWIEDNIGFWDSATDDSRGPSADAISTWANRSGLTGVVWTSLPCKFAGKSRYMPNEDEVVEHLRALNDSKRRDAEVYVRNAPAQIDTPYRRRIERELGWTYQK